MQERVLKASVLRWLRQQGHYAVKLHGSPYAARGMPDIYALIRVSYQPWAVPVHLELKRPGGRATALQQQRLNALCAAGAVVALITSVDELRAVIAEVQRGRDCDNLD